MSESPGLGILTGISVPVHSERPAPLLNSSEYAQLKHLVKQKGLLDKQPGYYAYKVPLTLGLLALNLSLLATLDTLWLQLLNAAFMAFVFTQIGLVGHDAGHQQIFRSTRHNDIILLVISFFIALDRSWWLNKHNRHHNNPNDLALDLDVNLPLLAFTEEQALEKRGLYRLVVKYQSFLFFPMLLLEAVSIRLDGIQYLLRGEKVKYPLAEPLLVGAHLIVYFGLLFYLMSAWNAVLFILVHQALTGLYMGLIFAANHKGMLMVEKDSKLDFLRRQVLTSRNVKGNLVVDFIYGGLNYQIEHHLFPSIPRNRLRGARKIVKGFCESHCIAYHEMGVLQSYREIVGYLHRVSAPLRESKPQRTGSTPLPKTQAKTQESNLREVEKK